MLTNDGGTPTLAKKSLHAERPQQNVHAYKKAAETSHSLAKLSISLSGLVLQSRGDEGARGRGSGLRRGPVRNIQYGGDRRSRAITGCRTHVLRHSESIDGGVESRLLRRYTPMRHVAAASSHTESLPG
jgi:hypothetical protein